MSDIINKRCKHTDYETHDVILSCPILSAISPAATMKIPVAKEVKLIDKFNTAGEV